MEVYYIKNAKGNLVPATTKHLMNTDTVLYNEDEEVVNRQPNAKKDPVAELAGEIQSLVSNIGSVQEKQEKMAEQLAAWKQAAERGFIMPAGQPGSDMGMGASEDGKAYWGYQLAMQGKLLEQRFNYRWSSPEIQDEFTKWAILFVKGGLMGQPAARAKFFEKYGRMDPELRTPIGDSGNEFPIPDIVMAEILAFARERSIVLQYASVVDMVSEKQSYPAESAGVTVQWGNTTQESEPTIVEVELDAEELSAYAAVKNMTLADSRSDIVGWLGETMAEAAGLELDNCAFNGDGTATYGGTSGLLTAACGYSVVMGSTSTAFSQVTGDVFSEMISKLDGLKKMNARFFMNGVVLHYIRTLKDSNGMPIFMERYGSPVPAQLLGYPYTEVIRMPSTSAANTAFVVFGNLRYFFSGRRLGATSLQVDPYGLWTTNRTRYKIYQRWGQKIALANGFARLLTAAS